MRIACVVSTYPLVSQTFVVNEMTELQEAGNEIILVQLYSAPMAAVQHKTFERFRPHVVLPPAIFGLKVFLLSICMFLARPLHTLRTLMSLHLASGANFYTHVSILALTPKSLATAWHLRRLRVEHIHAHFATNTATLAGIVGGVTGIPFSFTAHAYDIYCTNKKLSNDTLIWKLRHSKFSFAGSNYAAQFLRSRLPGVSDRIHTLYMGIPMYLFREEPGLPRGDIFQLLCVAQLHEKKGIDILIESCGVLRDRGLAFHLRIYGDGPLKESLSKQIDRLSLSKHVYLGGSIPQEEVARQLTCAHVFVMPCRQARNGDMDGLPTVFMEAMATGRPVISCRISGIPELVRHDETGLLVDPEDAYGLADAIIRLAENDIFRERLGHQASVFVRQQHDQSVNAHQLIRYLRSSSLPEAVIGTKEGIMRSLSQTESTFTGDDGIRNAP